MPELTLQNGYVDLQVNGYAGVDFNSDSLQLDSLRLACERLQRDGVAGILATVITADPEQMENRVRRLVALREQDELVSSVIWGLHIEGPFIRGESGFVGAHPAQHVRPAELTLMEKLLEAAGGLVRLVTLAPELDAGLLVTRLLTGKNIVVSAGHCDPSIAELRAAMDAGLTMFTHLGNGCPRLIDRHDNIIQRVLSLSDDLWITLITDGVHVPFHVLRNYLRVVGMVRAIVVTDATAAAGAGPGRISIGNVIAEVGTDGVPRLASDPRYLAGSALTMSKAAENLSCHLGIDQQGIRRVCETNPRAALAM